MLAHDQVGAALPHVLGAHDLVGLGVLEHAVLVDAALVGEGVLADDGLVVLHRKAGDGRDIAAGPGDVLGLDACVIAQPVSAHLQRHDHFFQGGVAGPLAHAVDGDLHLPGPALHAGQAVGHGQAQVVVAVCGEDHAVGAGDVLDQVAEHRLVLGGIGVAHGVGDVDGGGAGADGGLHAASQEVALGAGGVLGRPFHVAAQVAGVGDRPGHHFEHRLGLHLQLPLHVDRAGGDEGVDTAPLCRPDGLGAALDVRLPGAGQAADRALGDDLGDPPDGLEVAVGGDGKARLDDVDPHVLEDLGQFQLLVQGHGGAGRLLAIAHGGVEDDDPVLGVVHGGRSLGVGRGRVHGESRGSRGP